MTALFFYLIIQINQGKRRENEKTALALLLIVLNITIVSAANMQKIYQREVLNTKAHTHSVSHQGFFHHHRLLPSQAQN